MMTWKNKHRNFTYILWNESAVIDLITKEHQGILTLYQSYGHWVQRIDVAKYVILYHYGGWYIDLDISCKQSLFGLAEDMANTNKSVVMYAEENARVATDFFGITPRHPFMKSVLDALPSSNRWFLSQHTTIMISTGPSFMMGRYLNYPCQDDIRVLSLDSFARYALLSHDCSWCGQDSFSICFIEDHKFLVFCIILLISIVMYIFCRRKGFISNFLNRNCKRFRKIHEYERKTV
ncbi:uncharacterized protein LOC123548677 [Mercenaria mercenaria]|uniref:uncharacterized protein LOC123548677 n=1 Tax=Mercenaria mercenaria TaxID=6596 RepID=UPI00234E3806|nr:uncharacterized protein LOC123548677 [Mercenaria mercenaria]